MTASALNLSALGQPVQPGAAGPAAAAKAQGPLAGFEMLLAAFFGGQGEGQAGDPAQLLASQATPGASAGGPLIVPASAEPSTDVKADPDAQDAQPVTDILDPNLALIAALMAAPVQPAQAQASKPAPEAAAGAGGQAARAPAPTLPRTADAAEFLQTPAVDADSPAPAPAAPALPQVASGLLDVPAALPDALQAKPVPAAPLPTPTPSAAPTAKAAVEPAPAPVQQAVAAETAAVAAAETAPVPAATAAQPPPPPPPARERPARAEKSDAPRGPQPHAAAPAAVAAASHGLQNTHSEAALGGDEPKSPAAGAAATAPAVEAAAIEQDAAPAHSDQPAGAQPAQTAATAASAAPLHAQAAAVRGSPETLANLAAQIVKKLGGRSTRFQLELHPADLGRVDVSVQINAQGQVSAAMAFDNPQAACELKSRSAELQRALEQAGFDLSGGMSFDVAGDQDRSSPGFTGADDGQRGAGFRGRAFQAALDTAGEADVSRGGGLSLRRGLRSGVDVRI